MSYKIQIIEVLITFLTILFTSSLVYLLFTKADYKYLVKFIFYRNIMVRKTVQ